MAQRCYIKAAQRANPNKRTLHYRDNHVWRHVKDAMIEAGKIPAES